MHVPFAALFFFAILTLWVPGYWPVTVFQVGIFVLAAIAVWRARLSPPTFAWPLVPLSFAVLWGLFQWLTGRTAYAFDTRLATLRWATFLSVFLIGISLFRDDAVRRWFRSAILWFAFLVAVLATVQTFTSNGKVFWLFATPYTDSVMGPILNRNHYAAFIEAVLPIALYLAVRRERESLRYSGMAAIMYASVIASASRAGTVLATAEVVLVPLLLWTLRRAAGRNVAASLLRMGILFAVFTAVVGWESVWSRFWAPDPLLVRRELAVSTLHMAASHPWFGTGLGTWPTVYPRYAIFDIGAVRQPGPQRLASVDRRRRLPLQHHARHPVLMVPSSGVPFRLGPGRARRIPPRHRGLPVLPSGPRLLADPHPLPVGFHWRGTACQGPKRRC